MEMNPTVSKDVNVIPTKYIKALDSYFVVVVPPFRVFPSRVGPSSPVTSPSIIGLLHPFDSNSSSLSPNKKEELGYSATFSRFYSARLLFFFFLLLLLLRRRPPFVANNDFILRILPRNRVSELYDWLTHVFVTLFNPAAATQKKRREKKKK